MILIIKINLSPLMVMVITNQTLIIILVMDKTMTPIIILVIMMKICIQRSTFNKEESIEKRGFKKSSKKKNNF